MEKFRVENGELIFPHGVTKVDRKSFRDVNSRKFYIDRESVTRIVIPESVIEIGECAFDKFVHLESLSISKSVEIIGDVAFRDCVSLKDLFIPASVEAIAEGAFFCCSGLKSIVVEEGNTRYDSRNNCHAIIETGTNKLIQGSNSTVIPSTVVMISDSAFMDCATLDNLEIPESVQSIGDAAFNGCKNLNSLTIKNPNIQYGAYVFYGTPHAYKYDVNGNIRKK